MVSWWQQVGVALINGQCHQVRDSFQWDCLKCYQWVLELSCDRGSRGIIIWRIVSLLNTLVQPDKWGREVRQWPFPVLLGAVVCVHIPTVLEHLGGIPEMGAAVTGSWDLRINTVDGSTWEATCSLRGTKRARIFPKGSEVTRTVTWATSMIDFVKQSNEVDLIVY